MLFTRGKDMASVLRPRRSSVNTSALAARFAVDVADERRRRRARPVCLPLACDAAGCRPRLGSSGLANSQARATGHPTPRRRNKAHLEE